MTPNGEAREEIKPVKQSTIMDLFPMLGSGTKEQKRSSSRKKKRALTIRHTHAKGHIKRLKKARKPQARPISALAWKQILIGREKHKVESKNEARRVRREAIKAAV